MVDLNGKPKCEIICPVENCEHLSKISIISQTNLSAPPKFNPFNFERHYKTQHVIKNRRAMSDLTNTSNAKKSKVDTNVPGVFYPQDSSTPNQRVNMINRSDVQNKRMKVDARVNELVGEVENQRKIIGKLERENIVLRHKMMNYRETVRAVVRCKPKNEIDSFDYSWSSDRTFLKLSNHE